jgi:hypothetical protein
MGSSLDGGDPLLPFESTPTTTARQRLLTLAADGRIRADWHQAVIEPCGLCWPERPLYEVVQS